VPPLNKTGVPEEVIIYVNDENGKVNETLLFKILVRE
jgi:hypothetical protein